MGNFYKIPKDVVERLLDILNKNHYLETEDFDEVNNDDVIDIQNELEELIRKQK